MKIHGLVVLVALCLTEPLLAQTATGVAPDNFLPPSPRGPQPENDEPMPLPQTAPTTPVAPVAPQTSPSNMEAELKQFRNELREFQAMREEVARSAKTADVDADRVTLQQRQELVELLTKLATKAAKVQRSRDAEPLINLDPQTSRSVPSVPAVEAPAVPVM